MYRDLCKIPGEGISDSHAISMFLSNITDPAYATFVQIQKTNMCDLKTAVVAIRKHERDLIMNKSNIRRYGNHRNLNNVRRRRDDDDYNHYGPSQEDYDHNGYNNYGNNYRRNDYQRMDPYKRRRTGREETINIIPSHRGSLVFTTDQWRNQLSGEDKNFICDYNGRMANGEKPSLKGLNPKINVTFESHQRAPLKTSQPPSTIRRVDPHPTRDDDRDEMVTEGKEGKRNSELRRKISFNLHGSKNGGGQQREE